MGYELTFKNYTLSWMFGISGRCTEALWCPSNGSLAQESGNVLRH